MRIVQVGLLTATAAVVAAPTATQVATPATEAPQAASVIAAPGKRVFNPADYARFAPKTAYDMLIQTPGFRLRSARGPVLYIQKNDQLIGPISSASVKGNL